MQVSRELAQKEGVFTGTSGGGVLSAALEFAARKAPKGSNILVLLPDTGERYISTPLFSDIGADMTAEEKAIAAHIPSTQPPPIKLPEPTDAEVQFLESTNKDNKVVVWSMEYCEFCWTIFKFFDTIKVPYKVINWDSFEFAENDRGNKIRAALQKKTDCTTFPQCFIDGVYFGGAADACIKWKKGELQPILEKARVKVDDFGGYNGDPFEFLPKWMSQNPLRDK